MSAALLLFIPAASLYRAEVGASGRIQARAAAGEEDREDKAMSRRAVPLDVRLPADREFVKIKDDAANRLSEIGRLKGGAAKAANDMNSALQKLRTPRDLVHLLDDHYFKHYKRYFGQFRLARLALHPVIMHIQMMQPSQQAQEYFTRKQAEEPDPLLFAWTLRDLGQAIAASKSNDSRSRQASGFLRGICHEAGGKDRNGKHQRAFEFVGSGPLTKISRTAWDLEADDGTAVNFPAKSAELLGTIGLGPGGVENRGLVCALEQRAVSSMSSPELEDPSYDYMLMESVLLGTAGSGVCKPAKEAAYKQLDNYLNAWMSRKSCEEYQMVSQPMLCMAAGAGVEEDGRDLALKILARHAKKHSNCSAVGECWTACVGGRSCKQQAMEMVQVMRTKIDGSSNLVQQISAGGSLLEQSEEREREAEGQQARTGDLPTADHGGQGSLAPGEA